MLFYLSLDLIDSFTSFLSNSALHFPRTPRKLSSSSCRRDVACKPSRCLRHTAYQNCINEHILTSFESL
jgi:hypothetical protein